jgi:hypothetical protein
MRLLWTEGRFAWWWVGVVVFVSASLLVFDLVWRLVRMQIDTLAIYLISAEAATLVLIIFLIQALRRHFRERGE